MRTRWATWPIATPRSARRFGVGRLDREQLEAPVAVSPLELRARKRHAVELRALAAPRRPGLLRGEVADEGDGNIAHRRPVGDGDRDGVGGEAALGVHRTVDRVDHDAHRPATEVDLAALL